MKKRVQSIILYKRVSIFIQNKMLHWKNNLFLETNSALAPGVIQMILCSSDAVMLSPGGSGEH